MPSNPDQLDQSKKIYISRGDIYIRFAPDEIQAVYPITQGDSCCPPGFSVVLTSGKSYRLPSEYYHEIMQYLKDCPLDNSSL